MLDLEETHQPKKKKIQENEKAHLQHVKSPRNSSEIIISNQDLWRWQFSRFWR